MMMSECKTDSSAPCTAEMRRQMQKFVRSKPSYISNSRGMHGHSHEQDLSGSNGGRAATETDGLLSRINTGARSHVSWLSRVAHDGNDEYGGGGGGHSAAARWSAQAVLTAWEVLTSSYVNILLVFVPLGIIAGATGWKAPVVFVLNFLAIVPLASLLSFATEELSAKLGQTLGGLMNATFGNAVELIVRCAVPADCQMHGTETVLRGGETDP